MDGAPKRFSTIGRGFSAPEIALLGAVIFTMLVLGSAQSGFISIDCGLTGPNYTDSNGIDWVSDAGYIRTGENAEVPNPFGNVTTVLQTVRYFPGSISKNCYELPAIKNQSYLVRTNFFYGNYDGQNSPPTFFLIIESTLWTPILLEGSYEFEILLRATTSNINVCVAQYSNQGRPFISSLELRPLLSNMTYSYAFNNGYALMNNYRMNLGANSSDTIRYPHDTFDRLWYPYQSDNSSQTSRMIGDTTYEKPPSLVMQTAFTGKTIVFPDLNANLSYHITLFCAEIGNASLPGERVFDVYVNGYMNGTTPWFPGIDIVKIENSRAFQALEMYTISPMSPPTDNFTFTFQPTPNSTYGPLAGGVEILRYYALSALSNADDVAVLLEVQKDFNLTLWTGDPCLPRGYGWNWILCNEETEPRVTGIILSSYNLTGSISPNINLLTALTEIYLDHNALTGPIPYLSSLTQLTTVDLQNNNLQGPIPDYFADLPDLTELLVQTNQMNGTVPAALLTKATNNLSFKFQYGGNQDLYCGSTLCSAVSSPQNNSSLMPSSTPAPSTPSGTPSQPSNKGSLVTLVGYWTILLALSTSLCIT